MPKMVRQVEPLHYTIMDQSDNRLIATFQQYLGNYRKEFNEAYIAPDIPLDKLTNVLFEFAPVERDEKILAVVDMSIWDDGKGGIAFTDRGIWWKYISSPQSVKYSDPDYLFKIKHLPEPGLQDEEQHIYDLALKLGMDSVMTDLKTLSVS